MLTEIQKDSIKAQLDEIQFAHRKVREALEQKGLRFSKSYITVVLNKKRERDDVWIAAAEVVEKERERYSIISRIAPVEAA